MRIIRPAGLLLLRVKDRAQRDYLDARGTLHLKQIDLALTRLQAHIDSLHERISHLHSQLRHLEVERNEKLRSALLKHILSEGLKQVPGIGNALAEEILTTCYDGTLASLSRAYLYVRGIGEKRQLAINKWIKTLETRIPALLESEFPHKREIMEDYQAKIEQLKQTQKSLEEELSNLSRFQHEAINKVKWLRTVWPEHFVRAYQGDKEARDLVARYLLGVFPEWDEPPAWFKCLIKNWAEQDHENRKVL